MAKKSARDVALDAILAVTEKGRSLNVVSPELSAQLAAANDRALARELTFGVIRWLPRLNFILGKLLNKPVKAKDADVKIALLMGLYQLIYLRTPDYAAVNETVSLMKRRKKQWAGRFVNGVLRQFLRNQDDLIQQADANSAVQFAHPEWLVAALQAAWPDDWQAILNANNEQAAMTVRVNQQKISRDDYLQSLLDSGLDATKTEFSADGLILTQAVDVFALPGFLQGHVSVQDEAAQLAAQLLDLQPEQTVLDACAAPGGKTAHMLELQPTLDVTALDYSEKRLMRVHETLARLDLQARLITTDARAVDHWAEEGQTFDRILLDAPCSATGVIRRNPDIKSHRQASDIMEVEQAQAEVLTALWPLLSRGGKLLYATCSVLPAENAKQLERFVEKTPDVREIPIEAKWGRACEVGRQILPGEHGMDGFYYACLEKT